MNALQERLNQVLKNPLQDASAGGALGYVGLDIPADLLLAGGRVSCHLPQRVPADTVRSAQWLESSFPLWAHGILQSWWDGEYDCFDHVIFSRGEDATHRLYYYICELQRQGRIRGPKPLVFDVARIPRDSSRRHTIESLRNLALALGISDGALREGVLRANECRQLLATVRAQRTGLGSLYEQIARASLYTDLRRLLAGWSPEPENPRRPRIILAGSVPPDDRLHRLVEQAGSTISEELHDRGLTRLGPQVDATAQDLPQAIAQAWLTHEFAARDSSDAGKPLAEAVTRTRADAVILWCTREDEALAWRVPAQRAALSRVGVPALVLVARSWAMDDGADLEIKSFLREIPYASA